MAMIDREEAIRLVASYPGPVDKSVVRRLLTQMDDLQPTCNQLATDCISRQAAIDAVENCEPGEEPFMIKSLPSAHPEPKKGKWVSTDDGWSGEYFVCSACGCPWTLIEGSPEDNGMNFCPNCGADMRGEHNV